MRDVLRVVDQLQPQEQEVLALCAWAGLTYEEGAVALGVPVVTVDPEKVYAVDMSG